MCAIYVSYTYRAICTCVYARRNISNLRYADDTTLTAESEEELKNLLMKVKEESEKVGFYLTFRFLTFFIHRIG